MNQSPVGTATSTFTLAKQNVPTSTAAPKRKRKRQADRNEFLPDRSAEELEEETYGSLEFNEVLDEEVCNHSTSYIPFAAAPNLLTERS